MIDWNDAFDNSGYIEGAAGYPDRWAALAATARGAMAGECGIAYGSGPRERLDLFEPEGMPAQAPHGLVVFVHGGYWHLFDRSYWSHLAQGPVARGWAVAVLEYPLAPAAHIADITVAVARGVEAAAGRVAGPVHLAGHSAGGHLVTRMMAEGSPLTPATRARLARVVSISGVHDLRPLVKTTLNDTLRLTGGEAARESTALLAPLPGVAATAWVGARERPEFLRQTRLLVEAWERRGAEVRGVYDEGRDHFTVVEALADPDSPLTREVVRGASAR